MTFPAERAGRRARCAPGDLVVIDGEIVDHRRHADPRTAAALPRRKEPLPMNLHGVSLFHLGSYSREVDGRSRCST